MIEKVLGYKYVDLSKVVGMSLYEEGLSDVVGIEFDIQLLEKSLIVYHKNLNFHSLAHFRKQSEIALEVKKEFERLLALWNTFK